MVADMFMQDEISFISDTHQYFNKQKEQYTSVSKVLDRIKVPFDREGISRRMAMTIAEETGVSVEQAQKELLAEWEDTKNSSLNKGNYVHDGLEDYAKTGKVWDELDKPVAFMQEIFKQYYRFYPEVTLFSHRYKVAGRTDLILQRQKSRTDPVVDFIDYKSNEKKGICFDSIGRKEGILKHSNRYFLQPFDYLENCNYNIYSLQLSIYAFLAMELGDIRIGKLGIVFIDNFFNPTYIPVPFMYHEAKILCELNLVIAKPLPDKDIFPILIHDETPITELDKGRIMVKDKMDSINKQYPMTPGEAFQIKDDWD